VKRVRAGLGPAGSRCRGCGGGSLRELGAGQSLLHRPPTPTRNPPWRGIRCALPCRRVRAGLRPSGSRCRLLSCWGVFPGRSSTHMDMNGGARKNPRYGAESTSQVTIRKTATTTDWRARRGEACLVPALKSYRPDLQAEPFDVAPCRGFFRAPLLARPVEAFCVCGEDLARIQDVFRVEHVFDLLL